MNPSNPTETSDMHAKTSSRLLCSPSKLRGKSFKHCAYPGTGVRTILSKKEGQGRIGRYVMTGELTFAGITIQGGRDYDVAAGYLCMASEAQSD